MEGENDEIKEVERRGRMSSSRSQFPTRLPSPAKQVIIIVVIIIIIVVIIIAAPVADPSGKQMGCTEALLVLAGWLAGWAGGARFRHPMGPGGLPFTKPITLGLRGFEAGWAWGARDSAILWDRMGSLLQNQ